MDAPSYGLWSLVVVNSLVFILFAASFFRPRSRRDWRSLGAFSAFLVALFTEMYGFPLTVYLLSAWLTQQAPGVDWFAHDSGHLPEMLFGWRAHPHIGPFHLFGTLLIGFGFWLLSAAWGVLYRAQRENRLATCGVYARIRHPQYVAFVLIMTGFLVQWPTLVTALMFPVLLTLYVQLARREEREVQAAFGAEYERYRLRVPPFIPRRRSRRSAKG